MQLQQLFNYLPGVYFVVKDRDGRVMMANDVAARLCGLEHGSEMIGQTDYDLFEKDRADTYVKDDLHVFETGESIIDRVEMAPAPRNSINWFVTTKIPLYAHDDEIVGLACIARNMTDAYEKLRPYAEMNEVLEYVRENYAQPIKIEDLARVAHLSPSQFERRFRKVFHITPTRHILNVRIRSACHLLTSTNDTLAAIALDAGFYDHSHFTRSFKSLIGLSPSTYRKEGRTNRW
jgi:AraC-like DNA-binding protein